MLKIRSDHGGKLNFGFIWKFSAVDTFSWIRKVWKCFLRYKLFSSLLSFGPVTDRQTESDAYRHTCANPPGSTYGGMQVTSTLLRWELSFIRDEALVIWGGPRAENSWWVFFSWLTDWWGFFPGEPAGQFLFSWQPTGDFFFPRWKIGEFFFFLDFAGAYPWIINGPSLSENVDNYGCPRIFF